MKKKFSSKDFIKGKIAETIFEEMFLEAGDYTIIPFGYEKILPELANHKKFPSAQKVIDNIRTSPDYAVIMPDRNRILLIEVKFRRCLDIGEIIGIAEEQSRRWNPSWIFLATLDGFYLGECSNIINFRNILKLKEDMVSKDVQSKYLNLIKEFEK